MKYLNVSLWPVLALNVVLNVSADDPFLRAGTLVGSVVAVAAIIANRYTMRFSQAVADMEAITKTLAADSLRQMGNGAAT